MLGPIFRLIFVFALNDALSSLLAVGLGYLSPGAMLNHFDRGLTFLSWDFACAVIDIRAL